MITTPTIPKKRIHRPRLSNREARMLIDLLDKRLDWQRRLIKQVQIPLPNRKAGYDTLPEHKAGYRELNKLKRKLTKLLAA